MSKILVVDDSESIQKLYSLELADEGYQVFASKCNAQVFDRIEEKNPDLIILDDKPGAYNARNLLQDIRSTWRDVPVILCMAFPDVNLEEQSQPYRYAVIKRSDLSELKHKVRTALEEVGAPQQKGVHQEI